jgi:hypothetical protein
MVYAEAAAPPQAIHPSYRDKRIGSHKSIVFPHVPVSPCSCSLYVYVYVYVYMYVYVYVYAADCTANGSESVYGVHLNSVVVCIQHTAPCPYGNPISGDEFASSSYRTYSDRVTVRTDEESNGLQKGGIWELSPNFHENTTVSGL